MKTIGKIRAKIHGEIFDYQVLLHTLSGYRKPRDKITRLLAAEKALLCVIRRAGRSDNGAGHAPSVHAFAAHPGRCGHVNLHSKE